MTDETSFLTSTEAAIRLGTRLDYLYMMLRSGKIRGTRIQGQWAIPAAAILEREAQVLRRAERKAR